MESICIENDYDDMYKIMARSQDSIEWQRFMERMVCKEIRAIQSSYSSGTGLCCNTVNWGRDLVTRLLEVTHGQWLYRNVHFFAYGLVNNYFFLLQLCLFYTIYVGINNRHPTWDGS